MSIEMDNPETLLEKVDALTNPRNLVLKLWKPCKKVKAG